MAVYAVVSIESDHTSAQRTPIGTGRGSNRQWNHTVKFNFDEATVRRDLLTVAFCLKSDCEIGVLEFGAAKVSVKELLDNDHRNAIKAVPISLYGITKGMLNFKYKFSDTHANPGWSFRYPPMADYPHPPPPGGRYPSYGYQQPLFRDYGYGGMWGDDDYFDDDDFGDYFQPAEDFEGDYESL
ncbi:hypothetical protein Gogos_015745 [Gossypium gossypioides]|uniref:C2 domain-containing protein n=1 Tax=Gossypium gossypioides TaxID=34282 RepID=A0A7J9C2P2_GOSGO|nr:hypothetical protein [Gossypium gossypioides]